jgi:hypothetical protein
MSSLNEDRDYFEAVAAEPGRKVCCCCGGDAGRFEQWYNRDTGFGICAPCIVRIRTRETPEEIKSLYGVEGVHYATIDKAPNPYEEKQEARRARLERAADRARDEAAARFNRAHQLTDGIPFGQPILVGHHSEKRHRNTLRKADNAGRKGVEAMERARDLDARAAAVGTGGISSDDPDAIAKLEDKRTDLEKRRDHMKDANAFFKKHGTLEGWDGPADVRADGESYLRHSWDKHHPFPAFSLQNIGARIRDAKKRAERIEALAEVQATDEEINGARVVVDPAENRVLLSFPERLSRDDYKKVRGHGFVWSPTRSAFVRKVSGSAYHYACELARTLPTTTQAAQ